MRYWILIVFALMSAEGLAQPYEAVLPYRPFSFRIGLGSPIGRYNGGAVLQLEPSYRLNNNFMMGLRLESMSGALKGQSVLTMPSIGLNAQRYFLPGRVRPFAGIGVGFYSPQLADGGRCNCTYGTGSDVPGFYPRIGLDFGHGFINLEYNFIRSSPVDIHDQSLGTNSRENLDFSYMSFKAGIAIGGGPRRK